MDTGLRPEVIEEILSLAERYQLEKVILFGSRARGDYWRASDIDLAVQGGDLTSFSLEAEETVPTLLTFDIIDLSGALDADFLDSVMREGIVLYEKV